MSSQKSEKLFDSVIEWHRVVILGDYYVGKTSLSNRFFRNKFEEITPLNVGWVIEKMNVSVGGKRHAIAFMDLPGLHIGFKSMRIETYGEIQAALLCYDVSRLESFHELKKAMMEVRKYNGSCPIYLCATKRDLLDNAQLEQAVNLVIEDKDIDLTCCKLFVTSSKTGENVHGMFMEIIRDIFSSLPGLIKISDVKVLNQIPEQEITQKMKFSCRLS